MPLTRTDVIGVLAVHDPAELRAILAAAGLPSDGNDPRSLAERIVGALWWHGTTPIGAWVDDPPLEALVERAARRLGVWSRVADTPEGWERLRAFTRAVVGADPRSGVRLDDLDPAIRARLAPDWMPSLWMGGGAGTAAGSAWSAGRLLGFLRGPLGRLIPLFPPLAPTYRAVVGALQAARLVAWPLAMGLAVLAVNHALGPDDRKLVPLLLGVGALAPIDVEDAIEMESRHAVP